MKVLFINLPYYGHVVPTIGLVQELLKKNCEVTYVMPFGWEDKVKESGALFVGYPASSKLSEQIKNAYQVAERIIKDYDIVVYEQFFFLGKHLAEKYQKPAVRIFTAPVTNATLMKEYINAGGALGIFKCKWIAKAWTKEVAAGVSLKTQSWLDEIVENPPGLNLVYTQEDYQPYVEDFPREQYKFLGASVYERNESAPEFMSDFNVPVIYISLGTIVKGATSFFKKCIQAFQNEQVEVILSVGKNFDINKLGTIPDNFHVYHFVPQISALKIADVFVTHGGMNSVSEALVHGVPMVVIPFMADQPTNARRVEELGLGKQLAYKKMDSQALRDTTVSVMTDKNILENVDLMKEKMSECPGNAGGARMICEYYRSCMEGEN